MTSSSAEESITKNQLQDKISELFSDNNDIALFYFSWHWAIEETWTFLITSECKRWNDWVSMGDLMKMVNNSPAKNKIIILDCCHAGAVWNSDISKDFAVINEWVTILTASTKEQYASEENESGVFTKLFVDALNGSASNLLWDVTPGSIYSHIDQSLWPWMQRPMFKTNVREFVTLKEVIPPIWLEDLKMIAIYFEELWKDYQLDPTYEPDSWKQIESNVLIFRILQKYNRLNLVIPVDAEHMYYAAMNSKSCKLTTLWEHYWKLVNKWLI